MKINILTDGLIPTPEGFYIMAKPKEALVMDLVHTVVKNHGGTIVIDEGAGTFTVTIPESRRETCFQDISEIIGHCEPVIQYTFPIR